MELNNTACQGLNKLGQPNKQLKLSNIIIPVKNVVRKLKECFETNRIHQAHYEWKDITRKNIKIPQE